MNRLLEKLAGDDRRSIGRSNEVVAEVLARPALFRLVFEGLLDDNAMIRMRAADAVEKITAKRPELLEPYKKKLLRDVAGINQQEVRWHLALMIPRLRLTRNERAEALGLLMEFLHDKSSIVKTFAMQALADLALQDPSLEPQVIPLLRALTETGTPAMKARGRKLLENLHGRRAKA
jgi:hypothetical protein